MQDKTIKCKDCGAEFIFTEGEQAFYQEKGFSLHQIFQLDPSCYHKSNKVDQYQKQEEGVLSNAHVFF